MAVFQPRDVNLAPFYEGIARSKEKEGEAKAQAAVAKLAPIQAGVDAISKVGNFYLTKQLEKKIADQDKMIIPEDVRKNFIINQLNAPEGSPEFFRLMELSGKYKGDVPSIMKIVSETGQAIKEGTAIDDYLKSPEFAKLTPKEQGEIKLQLGFPGGREELFKRFGREAEIKKTAEVSSKTGGAALGTDKLKAKYMQEYISGDLDANTPENNRKKDYIQDELRDPDIKTSLEILSKSLAVSGMKSQDIMNLVLNFANTLKVQRLPVEKRIVTVKTSDGNEFTIPETKLEEAKKRDPNLKILRHGESKQ